MGYASSTSTASSTASSAATPVTTTFLISNLYCPSSITMIESGLTALSPTPFSISSSIVSQCVAVQHDASLPEPMLTRALKGMGFEIYSVVREGDAAASGGSKSGKHGWRKWR